MHGRSRTTSDCLCWKNEKKSVHAYTQYTAKKANGKESREKGVQISVSCEGFEGRLSLLGPFNRPSCHPRCLSYLHNSFWTSVITVSASLDHQNSQPVPPSQPTVSPYKSTCCSTTTKIRGQRSSMTRPAK